MSFPVYVINVKTRTDRKQNVLRQCETLGIHPSRLLWHHPHLDKRGGVYGCFESHMDVWNKFRATEKSDFCLVLEDDVVVSNKDDLDLAVSYLQSSKEVDILHLHNWAVQSDNLPGPIGRGYGLCTHAYLIRKSHIQRFSKLPSAYGVHLDYCMMTPGSPIFTNQQYYFRRPAFIQLADDSDNVQFATDKMLRQIVPFSDRMHKFMRLMNTTVSPLRCTLDPESFEKYMYTVHIPLIAKLYTSATALI
jgi:hypothetical protein